jgi:hypothetical protein
VHQAASEFIFRTYNFLSLAKTSGRRLKPFKAGFGAVESFRTDEGSIIFDLMETGEDASKRKGGGGDGAHIRTKVHHDCESLSVQNSSILAGYELEKETDS